MPQLAKDMPDVSGRDGAFVHARRCCLLREVSRPGVTGWKRTTFARYLAAHSRNIESLLCTVSEHRVEPVQIRVAAGQDIESMDRRWISCQPRTKVAQRGHHRDEIGRASCRERV